MKIMNCKAESSGISLLMENLVYILLIAVFSGMVIGFFIRFENQASIYEQIYAKEFALLIDKAEPGMEIEINIFELYHKADKNHFNGNVIEIDNEKNKVFVRLSPGRGYGYYFFNNIDVIWNLDKRKNKIYLKFIENEI